MAKINDTNKYPVETTISARDIVLATENGSKKTKNISVKQIADFAVESLDEYTRDKVVSIGEVEIEENKVILKVGSAGNEVLIDNEFYTKFSEDEFSFTPTINGGIKTLLIYALPTEQVFYLVQGVEAEVSIEPSIPNGALFIKRIVITNNSISSVLHDETLQGSGVTGELLGVSTTVLLSISGKASRSADNLSGANIASWQDTLGIDMITSDVMGVLKLATPAPVDAGKYILADIGKYDNLVPIIRRGETAPSMLGITTSEGYANYAYFDGANWYEIKSSFIQNHSDNSSFDTIKFLDPAASTDKFYYPVKGGRKLRLIVSNVIKVGTGDSNFQIKDSNGNNLFVAYYNTASTLGQVLEVTLPEDATYLEFFVNLGTGVTNLQGTVQLLYNTAVKVENNADNIVVVNDYVKTVEEDSKTLLIKKTLNKTGVFISRKTYPFKAGQTVALNVSGITKTGTGDSNVAAQDSNGNYVLVKYGVNDEKITATLPADADWIEIQLNSVSGVTAFIATVELRYGTSAEIFTVDKRVDDLTTVVQSNLEDNNSFMFTAALDKGGASTRRKYFPYKAGSKVSLKVSGLNYNGTGDYNVNVEDSNGNYLIVKYNLYDQTLVATLPDDATWIEVRLGFAGTITYMVADVEFRYGTSAEAVENSVDIDDLETTIVSEKSLLVDSFTNTGDTDDFLYGENVYFGYNRPVAKDSILGKVKLKLFGATIATVGTSYKFVVGTVDQRNWLLPRLVVTCVAKSVQDEVVTFDFLDQRIIMRSGELLFAVSMPIGANASLALTNLTYDANNKLLVTDDINDELVPNATYGATCFQVEVHSLDSVFALKDTLKIYDAQISSLQIALSQSKKYTDLTTGVNYELIVNNGVVGTRSIDFTNILVIGHSFVNYFNSPDAEWYLDDGENRAMAASVYNNQWALMLADSYGATLKRTSGVDFERNYSPTYDWATNWDVQNNHDAILVYLNENAVYNSTMKASWIAMLNYLKSACPNAKIYCTGSWDLNNKQIAIEEACQSVSGVTYVDMLTLNTIENKWKYGDYYFGRANTYYPIGAAAGHPNDFGGLQIANKFLVSMGGTVISDKDFDVNLNQSVGGTIETVNSKWLEGGLVTIRTNPNVGKTISSIVVTKKSGGTVTVTQRTNSKFNGSPKVYYTFTMPSENVTITPTWA